MESMGVVLVLGGILALLVTGLGFARKQQALVDRLKSGYNDQWVRLGKPEVSPFKPFNSKSLTELVSSKGGSLQETPELAALHSEARYWFYAFWYKFRYGSSRLPHLGCHQLSPSLNKAVNRTQITTPQFVHSLSSLSHKQPLRNSARLQQRCEMS